MLSELVLSPGQPVLAGRSFGDAGPYEQLYGSARSRVDPAHLGNAAIVDLALAPRDAEGSVACRADVWILKPVDASRGNGALLHHVLNRGRKGILSAFQQAAGSNTPSTAEEFGDGLLMDMGFTLAAVAWQADVPPAAEDERDLMTLDVPVLRGITGPVACEIVVDAATEVQSLGHRYHHPYEWSEPHVAAAVLTVRDEPYGPAEPLPRACWAFDRLPDGRAAVRLHDGFAPGRIYNLVYTGREPRVMDLGFAATRDFVSFLKHEVATPTGQPNPLAGHLDRAHAFGASQSGRFLRQLVCQGFNQDEAGRRVFDGLFVDVAGAGQGSFNHRFAQPSRHASAHTDALYATEQLPFHDLPQTDAAGGATAGLLDRSDAAGVTPRIFYANTSTEYWNRGAALIHTDLDGGRDVAPHPASRLYHFAGTQHGPGELPPPGTSLPADAPADNPVDFHLAYRALIVALDGWVRDGTEPPASAYPTLAAGTLVPLDRVAWPRPPGLSLPAHPRRVCRLDRGDRWAEGIIDREPPGLGAFYPVLLPQVDEDGNEIAGVRLPEVAVPLGTFTGWRFRAVQTGAPWALAGLSGSWLPFAPTREAARAAGDPRRSVEERYRSRQDYVAQCLAVARALVRRRLLLARDLPLAEERAGRMYNLAARPRRNATSGDAL